jgi:predicted anti-sigma-YlaC factor YlaD
MFTDLDSDDERKALASAQVELHLSECSTTPETFEKGDDEPGHEASVLSAGGA